MSDLFLITCIGAIGFTLMVQHFRIGHLERWRDRVDTTRSPDRWW